MIWGTNLEELGVRFHVTLCHFSSQEDLKNWYIVSLCDIKPSARIEQVVCSCLFALAWSGFSWRSTFAGSVSFFDWRLSLGLSSRSFFAYRRDAFDPLSSSFGSPFFGNLPKEVGRKNYECHLRVWWLSTRYPGSVSPNDNLTPPPVPERRGRGEKGPEVPPGSSWLAAKRRKGRFAKAKRPLTQPRYWLRRREEVVQCWSRNCHRSIEGSQPDGWYGVVITWKIGD